MKQIKYIDGYVALCMLVAVVIALMALFLSSCSAEAHRGPHNISVQTTPVHSERSHYWPVRHAGDLSLYDGVPFRTPFESGTEAVEWLILWPHLPSVAEQRIQIANDRLRAVVQDIEAKKAERAMTSLMLDWQRLYIALGEGLMAIGLMLVTALYWTRKDPAKSDDDLT